MPKAKLNLYEVMAKRNIRTIADVAKRSGLSRKAVSAAINNKTQRISLVTIAKLCDGLDCTVNELIKLDKGEVE